MHFEKLKGLLNQITQVEALSLTIINLVSNIGILGLEQIHNWQDLSVIWHESFSNSIWACNQSLQDFEANCNVFWVSGIQACLDWDNELWNNWQDLGTSLFKHIEYTLDCKESVWVHLFSDTFEEDWQVMMVIKLLNIDFPVDLVLWGLMFNGYWKISSVVE